jgi:protein required for attachment to host cells
MEKEGDIQSENMEIHENNTNQVEEISIPQETPLVVEEVENVNDIKDQQKPTKIDKNKTKEKKESEEEDTKSKSSKSSSSSSSSESEEEDSKSKKKENKKDKKQNIIEMMLIQPYIKESLRKLLLHLVKTTNGLNISLILNQEDPSSTYVKDLFTIIQTTLSEKSFDENAKRKFIEKYQPNLIEVELDEEDKQMEKKHFIVDYTNPQPAPKKKQLNTFYKVDECMLDSEEEEVREEPLEEEALVVDNLQEIAPQDQEQMGREIAKIVEHDMQIVKEIGFKK